MNIDWQAATANFDEVFAVLFPDEKGTTSHVLKPSWGSAVTTEVKPVAGSLPLEGGLHASLVRVC